MPIINFFQNEFLSDDLNKSKFIEWNTLCNVLR